MKGCELLHGKMSDHADVLTQICGISSSLSDTCTSSPISVFFLVGSFILVIVFSCHRSLQIFAVVFYHFYKPLKFCHHYYDKKNNPFLSKAIFLSLAKNTALCRPAVEQKQHIDVISRGYMMTGVLVLMVWNSGFETTADIHTVPARATRRSYGAINPSASPSATVINEIIADDADDEHNDDESDVIAANDRPQVGDVSIQHSDNATLVPVTLPAPDQAVV